jgi:anti-anti-sigma regulatory factor
MCGTQSVASLALGGIAPGDHACCTFGSDAEHVGIVTRYARDAFARGERLLYLGHRTDDRTLRAYLADAGIDPEPLLASGQLEVIGVGDSYVDGGGFDRERQRATLQHHARQARRDGYSSLAVMAEMSWALDGADLVDELLAYEADVTAIFGDGALHAVCQYDRRLFDEHNLARVAAAHPLAIETRSDGNTIRRGTLRLHERGRRAALTLAGEIDLFSAPYLAARLGEHSGGAADIAVDASRLTFIDVAGCRAIVEAARALPEGRCVRVTSAPSGMRRILNLCEWDDEPGLVIA